MKSFEDTLATIFGYAFMMLAIIRIFQTKDIGDTFISLIAFMCGFILVFMSRRVVFIERAKEGS